MRNKSAATEKATGCRSRLAQIRTLPSFPRKRESICYVRKWIPAFAGMTIEFCHLLWESSAGCRLLREGDRHSWWHHTITERRSAIPHHFEINIPAAQCCILLAAALWLIPRAEGAVFKCIDSAGRVAYQDAPCPIGSAETSVSLPALPPQDKSVLSRPRVQVPPIPRAMYDAASSNKIPKTIDAKGPLETWDRFGKALNRGDKDGALRELTPSAREKYEPVFDALMRNGQTK